ncbi:MAG: citrate lyase holo-[acyl-carrier protein] synthase [Anaerovoracaceae bacterium]
MNIQPTHMNAAPQQLTLMDLLDARENRVHHQIELLNAYPGAVLVSMTLNIPGPVKDSPRYRKALETGLHRLKTILADRCCSESSFTILHEEFRPLATGPEAYLVVRGSAANSAASDTADFKKLAPEALAFDIKKAAVSVEEGSALGRLFDMDVLIPGENFPCSISRSQLGAAPRRCLLCEEDAKACARSRAHTMDQLLEKINEILSNAGL